MITIYDDDLPISVAERIITGTKPHNSTLSEVFARACGASEEDAKTCDMFSIEEIKEIADYLMIYCNNHQNGD